MSTVTLPPGQTLTVTADAASAGNVFPFTERPGDLPGNSAVVASASVTFGPFAIEKRYQIVSTQGALTHSMAAADFPTVAEAVAATQATLPTIVGSVGDFCEIIGAGVPVDNTTGADVAGKGSRYTDITNGKLYINGGTKALPVWKLVTSAV